MAPTAPSAVMPASAPFPAPGPVVPAVHVEPAGAPAAASQPMGADTITRAPSSGHPVLRLQHPNMSGPSVVWVQQKLGVGTDGFFGPATKAAVQAFQSSHGLSPDGVVGPLTWAALGG
jgi:peptidoglycan hydrolase-like protein with peptidoglycan-binding domain